MKKIVTILFLLIVSIQFLPVRQMGKCLFDNKFVEEEVCKQNCDKFKTTEPGKDLLFFDLAPASVYLTSLNFSRSNTALHKPPITDIITPPPNA